ncbi:MAG: phasin, PhaP, partial [Tateyamaria sp.]|nr:phasin, PhaP [Tateyamaria sp.]
MTKNPDLTEMFKDVMDKFPVDMSSFEDVVKTATSLNEKLSHVAIDAAEKSTEISSKWT